LEDQALVQGLLRGDPEAQRTFDLTYRSRIYRACCHVLGYQDAEAEDVVQETFLAALQQLPSFQFRSSLYRWLHQIAMYKCFRVIRGRRRQVATLSEEMEGFSREQALGLHSAGEADGRRKDLLEAVLAERDALGEPCRDLLKRRGEQGLTYGQLAEALKVPVGTVMSRLARCLQALRERLSRRRRGGSL